MENTNQSTGYVTRSAEVVIRIGVLVFIFGWCFRILAPFFSPVIWGLIVAVAIYPMFKSLAKTLRGRTKLAASILTLVFLAMIIIPAVLLANSLIDGIAQARILYQSGALIPPPDESVKSWPAIAKPIADLWQLASQNLQEAVMKYAPQLRDAGTFALSLLAGTGLGVLQLLISIIIAGVFLGYAKEGGETTRKVFVRLAGQEHGTHFADLSEITIRNVVKGILGIAVIQSLLLGIGFVVAGVPAAGLWVLLAMMLAIVQIGVGPIAFGVVIYMFATADTLTASLLLAWTIPVTLIDNVLKPLMLGKGASVPMLVVFLGAIGGFASSGFLGLFLGPVVLSVGYILFQAWMNEGKASPPSVN